MYFYAGSQKLATYTVSNGPAAGTLVFTETSRRVFFGGKLISEGGKAVVADRVGSRVAEVNGSTITMHKYYPYGEERPATAGNAEKFGTYFRDATTSD